MKFKSIFKVVFLVTILLVLCTHSLSFAQGGLVKNVIFFIGDGMGISSIDLSRLILVGKEGYLDFEKAPYVGLQKTFSANSLVTDSAAAGTALATGFKTNNAWLGLTSEEKRVKSLLEAAKEKDKATALVTTVTITHATPAAFIAKTTTRDELPVADQYAEFMTADIFMGGGLAYFLPQADPQSKRGDDRNLVEEFKKVGYEFVSTPEELEGATAPEGKLLGLFTIYDIPYYMDREFLKADVPTLAQMTEKALEIMSRNPNGFFVMIEGGKIDWANHGHDAASAAWETYEFNEAVKVALEFLRENPDTLIVITSDHETGGTGLSTGKYEIHPEVLMEQKLSTGELAKLVKDKTGEEIKEIFAEFTGIDLEPEEVEKIKVSEKPALMVAGIISFRAQIGWTTTSHTGQSLPVYAFGKRAEYFAGVYDNTDVAKLIAAASGLELSK